jgi:hypothetical protein
MAVQIPVVVILITVGCRRIAPADDAQLGLAVFCHRSREPLTRIPIPTPSHKITFHVVTSQAPPLLVFRQQAEPVFPETFQFLHGKIFKMNNENSFLSRFVPSPVSMAIDGFGSETGARVIQLVKEERGKKRKKEEGLNGNLSTIDQPTYKIFNTQYSMLKYRAMREG